MAFDVAAEAYQRFMGRYADPLAEQFCAFARIRPGQRALDVGCGPGALTERLAALLGPPAVAAIDPSEPFVAAARRRCPGVDVRSGAAEDLPYAHDVFDAAMAQLVVQFMTDPLAGLAEMGRVTRPGGTVAACIWDHAGGTGPLSQFWAAVREVDPSEAAESSAAGSAQGHLAELFGRAGLRVVEDGRLTVEVAYDSFEEWWEPYTAGVGTAGDYLARLPEAARERIRRICADRLPDPPFTIKASAWAVRAVAP
jgi:SAM-dependent methyltransferase